MKGREREQHQGELLGRTECEGHVGEWRREEGEEHHRDRAADEGGDGGGDEARSASP